MIDAHGEADMRFSALTGLAAIAVLGIPLWALAPPVAARAVVVVAPPWAAAPFAAGLVGHADGALLRGTGVPWIVVARSDDPDFAARLSKAGAWLVVDAFGFAGCAIRFTARKA